MLSVKEKIINQNLDQSSVISHGNLPNIRDYEIIFEILNGKKAELLQCVFKGCIDVNFKNTLQNNLFSMDERLLENDRHEPDYPYGFVWAEGTSVSAPINIEENTAELREKEDALGIKFFKLNMKTTAYDLSIIFHDVEFNLKQETKIKTKVFDALKKHSENLKSFF